jgi:glycosyltransferase involved in cell wall biosynthesis
MISNPLSIHTVSWVEGFKENGVHVDVIFENTSRIPSTEIETLVECDYIEAPHGKNLALQSLRKLRIRRLFKDIITGNTHHQRLDYLGPIINKIASDGNYDLVHAHGLAAAALLANKSGVRPYTISVWGSDILLSPSDRPYLVPLMKDALQDSSFVHVQGNLGASKVREMCPECEDKIVVDTWGADTEAFKPGLPSDLLNGLNLPKTRWILSFRVLNSLYRTDAIIRAFAKISELHDDASLVVGCDGDERENLEKLTRELGVDDRVRFIGYVDRAVMCQLFSNAYIYVQYPKSDGVTITGMEAMSSGLPLISSKVGDTPVLIEHELNGYLVDGDSEDALITYMDALLKNRELRDEMGSKSRQLALEKHDRKLFFKNMVSRMRELLEV